LNDILKMYTCVPKLNFISESFQSLEPKQDRHTRRQTDRRYRTHYHAAFAAGDN